MNKAVNVVTDFEAKVAEERERKLNEIQLKRLSSETAINDALRRESTKRMVSILNAVADTIDYDSEMLERKLMATRRSEYGRVPAMINILANLYAWPVSTHGNPAEVEGLRDDIIEVLTEQGVVIDPDLLLDIKDAKGYHTFIDDEGNIVEAVEPDFEEYEFFILTFAEKAGLPLVDLKLSPTKWRREEAKAKANAEAEKQDMLEARKRREELQSA